MAIRRSLAARVSALVLIVAFATVGAAIVTLGQLRALQSGFDRLTEVYVVFNQRLADAHVQAVRIGEQVRTHANRAREGQRPDPAFLALFTVALEERANLIARAREPIDAALADPDRYGDEEDLAELRGIQESLIQLENLAALDEIVDPAQVLADVRTQPQIEHAFESLSDESARAIDELRDEVVASRTRTERATLAFAAVTLVLAMLTAVGVFVTLRPLRRLAQAVRDLGRGDWSQRIDLGEPGRDDEATQLASEFNTMAEALEERERRLLRGERLAAAGQLAAQITHEIRNPLSSVALNVELLEDELPEASPEARALLERITQEVDRLTAITEDYLTFARHPKPDLGDVDLAEEVRSLLDFMAPELVQAGLEVDRDLPDKPVLVTADHNQMRQAFMNLVRNAADAALDLEHGGTGRRPRLGVTLECKGEWACVVVSDNGRGIDLPPDKLDRIFEAFYTRKARGTGLGLPIVQRIVQEHGGHVQVASTSTDGTRFEVRLPLAIIQGTE